MKKDYLVRNLPVDQFPGVTNEDIVLRYRKGECNFDQVLLRYHYLLVSKSLTHMPGMDSDDVYQELCLRLLHCCNKWDETKGVSFITYLSEACTNNIRWILRKQLKTDSRKLNYDNLESLDATEYDEKGDEVRKDEPYCEPDLGDLEARDFLAGLKLSHMEQRCISYVLAGYNNTEIGNILGVTRNRVSQILRGLGRRLKGE